MFKYVVLPLFMAACVNAGFLGAPAIAPAYGYAAAPAIAATPLAYASSLRAYAAPAFAAPAIAAAPIARAAFAAPGLAAPAIGYASYGGYGARLGW